MHRPLPNPAPPRPRQLDAVFRLLAGLLVFALLVTGCKMVRVATNLPGDTVRVILPGRAATNGVDLVQLQQSLMRFNDEYTPRLASALSQLQHGTNDITQAQILRWKITFATETMSIATGPNAVANTLDMVVVVSLARLGVQNYWLPKVYGEAARPLLLALDDAEVEIWRIAARILTPEQQTQLREAIKERHTRQPEPESALFARALDFKEAFLTARPTTAAPYAMPSLFSFIGFDPLSGLDPATREIAQTRLFAERVLYTVQRMPQIVRWQTELLAYQTADIPEVQSVVTNSTQLAAAAGSLSRTAEKLPGQISAEREKIVAALQTQTPELTALTKEAKQALAAGSQMASNLNTALATFDAVVKTLNASSGPPNTNSVPFRIQDYTTAAAQIDATAQRLTELLAKFDQTVGSTNLAQLSAQVTPVVQQAQTGGRELVDYAFRRAILLVVLSCGLLFLTLLIYRWVKIKFLSPPPGAG